MENNYRERRKMARWTQYHLSAATGIDRARLSFIENGHVIPNARERAAIEAALLGELRHRKEELNAILAGV